ncbi:MULTISPECIES: CRISPR-associated helicase/endonuclease Cas3 [unclassified Actinomyces]|uniref:CRISPR-associated helicase/endonuclease Cas3 n=1 Tax=unclassified Actinomyces TaxID=2609248 RepID=UPI000D02E0DF|nr:MULTISPECIES: CRISPR-associated helicase/endonuclease Cas3 [unclassified Actinomyces]AVM62641.1 CRISPR-associated helicase/endonuclease Cas3 [Actinomyces sp. oral taxon 897]QQO77316.1 CRISPR-associated helicase/endonuclease Cas3 [Actinomyces sp. HMT897]
MELSARAQRVWAKSGYDPESRRWLPLWLHLLDSATLAGHLAEHWLAPTVQDLIEREFADSASGLAPVDEFCLLASWTTGVHDVGKCTPAFSCQVTSLDDRMAEVGLRHEHVDIKERRKLPHALAGHLILRSWLTGEHGWAPGAAQALASVVGAHHGIPPTRAALTNDLSGHEHLLGDEAWATTQRELLELVTARTGAGPLLPGWGRHRWSQPFLVELSGLVIVADWLASTEAYFPLLPLDDDGLDHLSPDAHAERVATGRSRLEIPAPWHPRDEGADPDVLLTQRFELPGGARATDVQARTLEAARTMELPGMLIVEESTGGGKTEAALMAAEVLAARTGRAGVLFALPTQATTDAMFSRELSWLERIEEAYAAGGAPSDFAVQLVHGRARLNEEARVLRRRGYEIRDRLLGALGGQADSVPRPAGIGWDEEEARTSRTASTKRRRRADLAILAWFNGRKKTMLADFVVTTVDHLLFEAMRAPHLAMRHLGLSRKVVVVDEVHSYSTYMNVYLDRALTWLASYGVPVVLLSATLSEARCTALVDAYRRGLRLAAGEQVPRTPTPQALRTPFPCLVTAGRERTEVTATSASGRRSTVHLRRLTKDALVPLLTEALADGGCALVVRNTVRRAQETYELLRETFGEDVGLNHARFTIGDRLAKDADLLRRFGPPRSRPDRPHRAVVVATQVVEQSLDVDFDLLVSDLAPIDLVLQRMGRLHRHNRPRPPRLATPTCYIDYLPSTTSDDPAVEPGAKAIYGEQDMLMSAAALDRVLDGLGVVTVPDDVHDLIEAVYGADAPVPPKWRETVSQAREAYEKERSDKFKSAQGFLLDEPKKSGRSTSLVGWLHTTASDNEEKGRAQVRDGEDSLEVILLDLHRDGGQEEPRTLPCRPGGTVHIIPTDRVPDPKVVRAMALSAVRLPASLSNARVIDQVIDELERWVVPAWQDEPQLRGQLFLVLEDGRAHLGGKTLEYSPTTGLKEISPQ